MVTVANQSQLWIQTFRWLLIFLANLTLLCLSSTSSVPFLCSHLLQSPPFADCASCLLSLCLCIPCSFVIHSASQRPLMRCILFADSRRPQRSHGPFTSAGDVVNIPPCQPCSTVARKKKEFQESITKPCFQEISHFFP